MRIRPPERPVVPGPPESLRKGRLLTAMYLAAAVTLTTGCRQDMHDQAKYEPLESNPMFANDMASRPLVENTVPRGFLREDTAFYTGLGEGKEPLNAFPMKALRQRWIHGETMTDTEMNRALLLRGKKRFDTFCAPCHDSVGTGNGAIVQRGFKRPPSLHEDRLREALPGYFVNVITEGFGQMSSYAPQIVPEDRWAVAAYIRALQLSQNARLAELPPEVERGFRQALAAASSSEASGDHGEASAPGGHASKSPDDESRSPELPAAESANLAAPDTEVGES